MRVVVSGVRVQLLVQEASRNMSGGRGAQEAQEAQKGRKEELPK